MPLLNSSLANFQFSAGFGKWSLLIIQALVENKGSLCLYIFGPPIFNLHSLNDLGTNTHNMSSTLIIQMQLMFLVSKFFHKGTAASQCFLFLFPMAPSITIYMTLPWNSQFTKPDFSNMWTVNFLMFKLVLEKAEEPEIKLPTSAGSSKKQNRVPEKHLFLLYWLCQSLSLCGSQETVENSKRDGNTRPPDLPLEKSVCRSGSNS